jgi:hypothetical protein
MGTRTRSFEANLKEIIRRNVNNHEIKGTEKLKWILAGIKLLQLEKITGSPDHGAGFATLDRDDDDDDMPEEGAPNGDDGATGNGGGPRA